RRTRGEFVAGQSHSVAGPGVERARGSGCRVKRLAGAHVVQAHPNAMEASRVDRDTAGLPVEQIPHAAARVGPVRVPDDQPEPPVTAADNVVETVGSEEDVALGLKVVADEQTMGIV